MARKKNKDGYSDTQEQYTKKNTSITQEEEGSVVLEETDLLKLKIALLELTNANNMIDLVSKEFKNFKLEVKQEEKRLVSELRNRESARINKKQEVDEFYNILKKKYNIDFANFKINIETGVIEQVLDNVEEIEDE